MQVSFRNLLATGLVALVASCTLNHNGLGAGGGAGAGVQGAGGTAGAAASGAGTAGMTPIPSGAAGAPVPTTGGGGADASGTAGADAAAGAGGDGGAAGADPSGDAGASGTAGAANGMGAAGDTGGVGGQAGNGTGGSTVIDPVGCSDGTREGFVDIAVYPNIAACAGGWDEPGLLSMASRTPECERRAGNESDNPDGGGCSVADLCSAGWHVCETAQAVAAATAGIGCAPAYELYLAKPAFFVTRQRAEGLVCDATNQTGTNNLYGCGNVGSAADKSCAPFMHMLRDSDCHNHMPWACADGQIGNAQDEYSVVTKAGSAAGGVLCCAD